MQRGSDLAAIRSLRQRDALDESTDSIGCLVALLRVPNRFGEAFHLAALDTGDVGVNIRDIDRCAGETGFQFIFSRFKLAQARHQGAAAAAILD